MSYKVIVTPLAKKELIEAKNWYSSKSEKIGIEFISTVDHIMNLIQSTPKLYSIRYKHIRMGLLNRFPYAIHYIIEDQKIIVLSVMHTKRKPKT